MVATPVPTASDLPIDQAWDAVVSRSREADGRFVFAVTTTGIYCRPGCPARRPRREHVRFFAAPADARAAGFRACRRCDPDDPPHARAAPLSPDELLTLTEAIDAALADGGRPSVDSLARRLNTRPDVLRRRLEASLGVSPRALLSERQLALVRARLRAGDQVTDAVYNAGLGSSSRLYERARASFGMTPGVYRRGGEGEAIGWTTASTPLGLVLVAATSHGVCAVYLSDDEASLHASLEAEFPRAVITRAATHPDWVEAAVAVACGQMPADVPLDLRGTAFQQRVWQALRRIPRGETRTYTQLAGMIGQPAAVRAAARACATNKVSLLVPCHRVVGSNASLTGYRWGMERKRRLLELERGK